MSDRHTLLQDIVDEDLRSEVKALLDDLDAQGVEKIVEEVIGEASGSISRADREAIAREVSRRTETFFKGTILVGYIDLRRQIKAAQREIAALRKDHDGLQKQVATKEGLEEAFAKLDARIQSGLKGSSGSDRKKEMEAFYDTVDETADNMKKIMAHLGIKP